MKVAVIFYLALGLFISFFSLPPHSLAQDNNYLEQTEKYSREELAQMLAPIALYPDALLTQVLMASTYPIELIEADRWVRRNPELKDEALEAALLSEAWEPSVKALCHFPSILALMSERITETTNLGNAFLAQEAEVMDMVQELRGKANTQGNLSTTSEQKVIVEKETIIIEPADPRVIYVPYYDPFYIYGPWWYPAYPPYYWGPTGISLGIGISYWPGFYFGFTFGSWSYFDWPHRYIYIDTHRRPRYVRRDRWISAPGRWHHTPIHRRGVAYRDKHTAKKYGQYPNRSRDFRRDTRGFPENLDRDRDRDRRGDRIRIDRERKERVRVDRDKQKQRERSELGSQVRQREDQERSARERIDPNKQKIRERSERSRQERERVERDKQMRQRSDKERSVRQRVDRDKQKIRELPERGYQEKDRVERDRQIRQQPAQERPARQRVDRTPQQRSQDNVFNRVENGKRERKSSNRGRASRQGRGINDDWGRKSR